MNEVSDFFARSPEFIARYGALDNAEFVSLVYQNVLGRNPDAAGFAFWTRQLQAGHPGLDDAAVQRGAVVRVPEQDR